jgi:flagellar M-ring protein FliF
MDQLRKLIASLTLNQRLALIAAAALVIGGIMGMVHWRKETDFRPLFTNLASEDAGAVVQKLRESGAEYRLEQGGATVLVPSAQIAELRLELASSGLPKTGRIGFELFDKANFSATEFTEKVNYRRALEGELERSIMTLSEVESARVHVTFPRDSVFLESQQPAKASIIVCLHRGAYLSKQNVAAITNLAASAVEGLSPEFISVIDGQGNLLSRPRAQNAEADGQPPDANLDYKQKVEADLLSKVNTTLEPLLGADKFRTGVTVDCDFTRSEESEESLDPTKSVMQTSMKTDEETGTLAASGVPGTASNLPRPTSRPGSTGAGVSHHTENITYQTSRTVRHTVHPQGVVKKISVSVLIDQKVHWQGSGSKARLVVEPPSAEKLKTIKDLLAGVIGVSAERGDQVLVETLPFDATLNAEPPPAPPAASSPLSPSKLPSWLAPYASDPKMLTIGVAALVVIMLVLTTVLFLVVRRKKTGKVSVKTQGALPGHVSAGAISGQESADQVRNQIQDKLAAQQALQAQVEENALLNLKLPTVSSKKSEVLVKHLRESVTKDTPGSANILRSWLTDSGSE